jgi:hypothetical protein
MKSRTPQEAKTKHIVIYLALPSGLEEREPQSRKNLPAAGRISQATVDILDRFHHSGFSACEGEGVSAGDSAAREWLAS